MIRPSVHFHKLYYQSMRHLVPRNEQSNLTITPVSASMRLPKTQQRPKKATKWTKWLKIFIRTRVMIYTEICPKRRGAHWALDHR